MTYESMAGYSIMPGAPCAICKKPAPDQTMTLYFEHRTYGGVPCHKRCARTHGIIRALSWLLPLLLVEAFMLIAVLNGAGYDKFTGEFDSDILFVFLFFGLVPGLLVGGLVDAIGQFVYKAKLGAWMKEYASLSSFTDLRPS